MYSVLTEVTCHRSFGELLIVGVLYWFLFVCFYFVGEGCCRCCLFICSVLSCFFPEKALMLASFVKKVTEWLWAPLWEWGDSVEKEWEAEEEKKNTVLRFRKGRKQKDNKNTKRYNSHEISVVKLSCPCRPILYGFYTSLQIIHPSQRSHQQQLWGNEKIIILTELKKSCCTDNLTAVQREKNSLLCVF